MQLSRYENQPRPSSGVQKHRIYSETVEKVPKQILGRDAEKNDFTECATINDLMKGRETHKNQELAILKGFRQSQQIVCPAREGVPATPWLTTSPIYT